jgi:hypothetical protein
MAQFNIRDLPDGTALQINQLTTRLGYTKTQLVIIAIDRMFQQEDPMSEEFLSVVELFDNNPSGTVDTRLAHIGDDWFVYTFNLSTAQVYSGKEFAKHSAAGIRYLFASMTEDAARQEFARRKTVAQ